MLPKERNLEESIENHLVSIGYEQGHSQEFEQTSFGVCPSGILG